MMQTYFSDPPVEEGIRNIILQNRCGSRLTLLFFGDRAELEFVYKPNAFRRKDFRARNFSNRDNFTTMFSSFVLPDTEEKNVKSFDYDPFVTSFSTETASMAKNTVTVINIADDVNFTLGDLGRAPAIANTGNRPQHVRAFRRPGFQQACFRRNPISLRAAELRPVGAKDNIHSCQQKQRCRHSHYFSFKGHIHST